MMKADDLKNSVLQMAMQGKLVPQDPNDEPASVLLEKIKQEKEQLIKDKKIKRNNKESTIWKENGQWYEKIGKNGEINVIDDKILYEIPNNWIWCTLENIVELINGDRGKNYPAKSKLSTISGIPFISAINLSNGLINETNLYYLSQNQYDLLSRGKLKKNDLIFCLRGSLGKNALCNIDKGAIASSLVILRRYSNDIYLKYLFTYINSPIISDEIKKYSNGTAQPNLGASNLKKFFVPIPPLNEQKRIVEKLEQILPQIEQYAKYEEQLTKLNEELPDKLKKSILQQAIQGKLVPQNPEDEPASVLLEKIKQEKEQLIKDKKIKRNKNESTIYKKDGHWYEVIDKNNEVKNIDDEILYEIPETWTWVRLETVTNILMGQSPKGEFVNENTEGMEFHQGKIFFGEKYLLKSNKSTTKPSKISEKNSLLLCVRAPVGKINLLDRRICIGRGLASIKPIFGVNLDYLYYLLLNYEEYFNQLATGSTFKAIKKDIIVNTLIPIPPNHEQILIKETIEKLFDYIK